MVDSNLTILKAIARLAQFCYQSRMYTKNFSLSKSEASFAVGFESFYCKVVLGLALLFVLAGCDSKTASNVEPKSETIPAKAETKPAKTKIEPTKAEI